MTRPAHTDPMIGSVINERYEVIRKIAKGGMGTIYEVRSTRLGKSFALKTLTAEAAEDPEVLIRFRREAEVVAKLSHPNIVEVVDWDKLDDGSPFLVMEYLRGEPLAVRVRKGGPLAWPKLALISDQVLAGLTVAHRAGVIHRDLKPENIFLTLDDEGEERVKLLDFGISKLRDSKTLATTDARVLGTPAYMAPEQAEGRHDLIGSATDVWSIGAILYEMATGVIAFDAPSTPAMLYRVCHGEPTPVAELRPDAPEAFVALIAATLTRDVANRPADVELIRIELRHALRHLDGVNWPEPLRNQTPLPGSVRISVPVLSAARSAVIPKLTRPETIGSALPTLSEPPTARRRWPLIAAAAVVFAGAGVAAFFALRPDATATTTDRGDPPAPPAMAAVALDAAAPVTPPDAAPPIAPQPPAMIDVTITSTPTGAEVYRMPDAVKVGVTPWTKQLAPQAGTAVFVIRKKRYDDERVEIDLEQGGVAATVLHKTERRRPGRDRGKGGRQKGEPVDPFSGKK